MILVTGGTGFVGRHLVSRFVAEGHTVRVMSRDPGRAAMPEGAAFVVGDLADEVALREALRGVETVIHAAAVLPGAGVRGADLERTNADGTGRLARLAARSAVRQFVHISSAGVYGDRAVGACHREGDPQLAESPYQRSKLAAERALIDALARTAVNWTVLRPAGLYGADRPATQEFFKQVARRLLWLHGPVPSRLHPTHIDDLADAVCAVVGREDLGGEAINVGGARPVSYRELIALVAARVGRRPVQIAAPGWTHRLAARLAIAWSARGRVPGILERIARPATNSALDIDKARRLLGYRPMPLEVGIDLTVDALRAKGIL